MKFREVSAQQVGGLSAAALLAAGGGRATWKLRSLRRKLRSTDKTFEALSQKHKALNFLWNNPLIFKTFFKEEVRQIAKDTQSNFSFSLLAFHDEDGFSMVLGTLTPEERKEKKELFEKVDLTGKSKKTKDIIQRARNKLAALDGAEGSVAQGVEE